MACVDFSGGAQAPVARGFIPRAMRPETETQGELSVVSPELPGKRPQIPSKRH